MFHSAKLSVGAMGGNLVEPRSVIAVRPQPRKTVIGAQEYVLREIFNIRRCIPAPVISHQPPKIREDLVVMSFDQFFKAKRHFSYPTLRMV
jgi:hypothetical protein